MLTAIICAIPFIIHDIIFTNFNIWSFNPHFITGIKLFELPIEELFFFITVPYSCLFIYEAVKYFFDTKKFKFLILKKWSVIGIYLVVGILFLANNRLYTGLIFLATGVSLYCYRNLILTASDNYWRYIGFSLLGFLFINFWLTYLPVVTYNPEHIMNFRILSIPIEDFLYFWNMNTLIIVVYSKLTTRNNKR
jgi:lycopene cyclase domain-containing protein